MTALVLGAALALAQQPPAPLAAAVQNARQSPSAVWLSYRVPIADGPRVLCFDGGTPGTRSSDLRLAVPASTELVVFARFEHGAVDRIRTFTPECPVDAGPTPIVQVAGVTGIESVAWLASLLPDGSTQNPAGSTTAEPASAASVLGGGGSTPARLIDSVLLALSLHADPSALPRLIDFARDDARTRVRTQALFWLARRASDRAVDAIGGAVENDPDAEVRKKAVFALSRLPKDEGVPKLIEVARHNAHAEVRRQAIFWLGQSNDPRAVRFLEEILSK